MFAKEFQFHDPEMHCDNFNLDSKVRTLLTSFFLFEKVFFPRGLTLSPLAPCPDLFAFRKLLKINALLDYVLFSRKFSIPRFPLVQKSPLNIEKGFFNRQLLASKNDETDVLLPHIKVVF